MLLGNAHTFVAINVETGDEAAYDDERKATRHLLKPPRHNPTPASPRTHPDRRREEIRRP